MISPLPAAVAPKSVAVIAWVKQVLLPANHVVPQEAPDVTRSRFAPTPSTSRFSIASSTRYKLWVSSCTFFQDFLVAVVAVAYYYFAAGTLEPLLLQATASYWKNGRLGLQCR